MNRSNTLSALLGAVIAGLVAVIVFLGGCAGADAGTEPADPTPATPVPTQPNAPHKAHAAHPGRVVVRVGGGGGGTGKVPRKGHTTPPPTHSTPPVHPSVAPEPARLSTASVPTGATYDPSSDGQAFTTVFSTLESGSGKALRKTQSTTLTITGDTHDAVLELAVSGYALTEAPTNAKVTVTANRRTAGRFFRRGSDDEFVVPLAVPLRGAHKCTVTLTVQIEPDPTVRAEGYINISSLDGQFV